MTKLSSDSTRSKMSICVKQMLWSLYSSSYYVFKPKPGLEWTWIIALISGVYFQSSSQRNSWIETYSEKVCTVCSPEISRLVNFAFCNKLA